MCKFCKYWQEKFIIKKDNIPVVYGLCKLKQDLIQRIEESAGCVNFESK